MTAAVRAASLSDVDWLILQLKQFSAFFGTRRQLLEDESYAREQLGLMIQNHLVLVAVDEVAGPVGFIGGWVGPQPLNPRIRTLTETFWWVDEHHRNSRAGLLLLEVFIKWGRQNCDWIAFTLEANSPVREETLTKRGFHLHERAYLMENDPVDQDQLVEEASERLGVPSTLTDPDREVA